VPALLRLVREKDPNGAVLLALRLGLGEGEIEKDEILATEAMVEDALEVAATLLSEPHLSLRLPADLPLRRYGFAELAARSTTSLREGLARMARYASLIHPTIVCTLEETDAEAAWMQRTPARPRGIGRYAQEYALSHVVTYIRRETEQPVALSRVWFAHARPPDLAPIHRFFATRDVSFGCEASGFALPRGELDGKLRSADARLLATADDLAEAALRALPRTTELALSVASRVEALLPGNATIGPVASALHMSERTLQRKLDSEGASFSEIVDNVRERLARRWLADERRALSEIAFALGFSDLATFSRAFKRWTGKPPGAWRRG
jgi:AraC-like DNA-binding protein